jgi:hypothetical protein
MFISEKHQFIYLSSTKSGSSSVYKTLGSFDRSGKKTPNPHQKIDVKYIPLQDEYTIFTVVRNPYARLVSWWYSVIQCKGDRYGHKRELMKAGLSESFVDFVRLWAMKKLPGTKQSNAIDVNKPAFRTIRIVHLENIDQELSEVLPEMEMSAGCSKVPVLNRKTRCADFHVILCEDSISLINEHYSDDFEYFGYEKL